MNFPKVCSVLLGLALAGGIASSASAAQLIITNVGTGNPDYGNVTVQNWGQPWTTPILMFDSNGVEHIVFCDDLQHDVNVGGGQQLHYETGLVTVDGSGKALSESVSNIMGQIANLGRADYLGGNEDGAIAAQAAIWAVENGLTVSSTDATVNADIQQDLLIKDNGQGWANGLIAEDGTQSQIIGVGGVPEPATWAMMLMGVGGVGAALRRNRTGVALAAA